MRILQAVDRTLTAIVNAALVLIFAVMLTLAATQVFLRDLFHTGIYWGDVAARYLVIWVGFLGAFLATRGGKHFHIDVLTRFLNPRARLWFNAFSDLFASVVCLLLTLASATFVREALDPESTVFLGIPETALAMIVPVGFGLIMAQFVIKMIESIVNAMRGTVEKKAAQ